MISFGIINFKQEILRRVIDGCINLNRGRSPGLRCIGKRGIFGTKLTIIVELTHQDFCLLVLIIDL